MHHCQVEAGHLGDRADDRLAVGRHRAYADPGAEQLGARGAAESGPDGGEGPFGRICSGNQPVRAVVSDPSSLVGMPAASNSGTRCVLSGRMNAIS